MLIVASINKTPEDEIVMIPVFIFAMNFPYETKC